MPSALVKIKTNDGSKLVDSRNIDAFRSGRSRSIKGKIQNLKNERRKNVEKRRSRLVPIQDVARSSDELSSSTKRKRRSAKSIQNAVRRRKARKTRQARLSELQDMVRSRNIDPETGYPIDFAAGTIYPTPAQLTALGLHSYRDYLPPRRLPGQVSAQPNAPSAQFNMGLGPRSEGTTHAPLSTLANDLGHLANAVSEIAGSVAETAGNALQSDEARGLGMMARDISNAVSSMFFPGGRREVGLPEGARFRYDEQGTAFAVDDDQDLNALPGGGLKNKRRRSNKRSNRRSNKRKNSRNRTRRR